MTRATITPQFLADLLDTHAIGADAPGGAGIVRDQSLDHDHSEVRIDGTYDLSMVASDLNLDEIDRPVERPSIVNNWIIAVLMFVIVAQMVALFVFL